MSTQHYQMLLGVLALAAAYLIYSNSQLSTEKAKLDGTED